MIVKMSRANHIILENNLSAWEKKFPGSRSNIEIKYQEWKKKEPEQVQVGIVPAYDGNDVLYVKKDGKLRYLGGKRNVIEPVEMWFQLMGKIEEASLFFIGGMGNILYLERLLTQCEKKRISVVVYEPSADIFFKMLEQIDLKRALSTALPLVFVVDQVSDVKIENVIGRMITMERMEHVKTSIVPNYDKLFPKEMLLFATEIRKKCDSCAIAINTKVRFSNVTAFNVFANAHFVIDGYKTRQLADVIPRDIPAIIVAAGPSLNKNILELKRAKGKAFIIAVDTAMKPLIKMGIIPDMFAVVDGKKPVELIQVEGAEQIPLLASVSAAHDLLDYHKGKKFFFDEGYIYIDSMFAMTGKSFETVPCGGSVATSAFALAYMIGMKHIILVGQDLALTENKTHADGTFKEKMEEIDTSRCMMVKGNVAEKVPTRGDLKTYLDWYNYYIAGCKEVCTDLCVINATEGGAYIENTEVMSLREAIDQECQKEVDIQACINQLEPIFNKQEREQLNRYLRNTPQYYGQMKKDAQTTQKVYKNLKKLCDSGNVDLKAYEKILRKIKKLTKKIEGQPRYFGMIQATLPLADYIVQSERYDVKKSAEEEGKEIARQGLIYTDLVAECAGLFEQYTAEIVLKDEDVSKIN